MELYKGIFWFNHADGRVIAKKSLVITTALEEVEYSSKSGDNFNHKA